MPGKPGKVSFETMFEVLKDLPIFEPNGELKRKRDPVWTEACQLMPDIHVQNLYFCVYQDRKDLKTKLLKYMNIEPPESSKKKKKKPKKESFARYNEIWDEYDYYDTLDLEDEETETINDMNTLTEMKNSKKYKNIIHKISMLPFSVYYWIPEQIDLWADLINVESTVSLIVLDNVIADYIPAGNLESSKVFLYAMAVKVDESVILTGQMMSDSTASSEIECFLNTWLQYKAPAPLELVIDYSHNLLDAASLSFNFCRFNEYNIRCYKYLMSELESLPSTLIQIDIIGLINTVDAWSCFDNIVQSVKDLYLCGIMYISTINNLEEFKDTVISLLTLCQSPFQTEELEKRRIDLWSHLTTDTIQQIIQSYIDYVTGKHGTRHFTCSNQTQTNEAFNSSTEIYNYIEQLNQLAFEICDFNADGEKVLNEYYCPIVLESLINLLLEFPSWTKIINKGDCSLLVSYCSTKHYSSFKQISEPLNASNFIIDHLKILKETIEQGNNYINSLKQKGEFSRKEYKNNHMHLRQHTGDIENELDQRIEITVPILETNTDEFIEIDLTDFKNCIQSTIKKLLDFDGIVQSMLTETLKSDQEISLCNLLLETCSEVKGYEKFLGIIAGRLCLNSDKFATSFRKIFIEFYNSAESLDKLKLKNTSKSFAQLLISDSIPWTILSFPKLNENTSTAKKNIIRIILSELSEHMGTRFLEKFENPSFRSSLRGLFPMENSKEAVFAATFYRSIGLKVLADIIRNRLRSNEPSKLKRSLSNSSISSNSSCEFIVEVKVKKKHGKDGLRNEKTKVIKIK